MLGSINVDVVVSVKRHPRVGETLRATKVITMPGGKGANQAVAAAAHGAHTVMIGARGSDPDGDHYRSPVEQRGVDIHGFRTSEGAPGHALITVDAAGNNSIVIDSGANGDVGDQEHAELQRIIEPGDVVSIMLEIPETAVVGALRIARTE